MRWLWLVCAGCSAAPATQLILDVDEIGLAIPGDIDQIRINAGTDKLEPSTYLSVPVALCAALHTAGCLDLPVSVTLVPGRNRPNDVVRVEVVALRAGIARVADVVNFHFVQEQSQRLRLTLTSNCLDDPLHCADAETSCAVEGCYAATPGPAGAVVRSDLGPFTVTL
jgi:hypothetical protein